MAAVLHASLHAKLLTLPGEIEIFSGYQAGSVCGDEERQKLMAEHMQTMRENMMAAKGMMKGRGDEGHGHCAGMECIQMMEKRMDMMQIKMDAMMKNQSGVATSMGK